ncbi:MAG: manganese efflux pump MntP family protein [bacterium]
MSMVEIIFLAIALSIDAAVVSFSQGLVFCDNKRKNSLFLAFFVGFFQFLMPIIGWLLAKSVYKYIEAVSLWIAFAIFVILGIKFIKDAFEVEEKEKNTISCLSLQCLLMLAFATSIDALASGSTLFFLKVNIWLPSLIIGVITFFNSLIGFWSGYILKQFPSKWLEVSAGIILIILGFKSISGCIHF